MTEFPEMKKYLALTALALLMATPASAESVNDTNIKRTMTAVERAAIQQGFIKVKPGEDSALMTDSVSISSPAMTSAPPSLMETAPTPMLAPTAKQAPSVFTDNHTVMMMAPKPLPVDAAVVPAATSGRPSLIKKDLPYGLVMDGPGTEAYKKKKRRQKKAEEARRAEPAPVVAPKAVAAPEPVMMREEPAAMPDHNSLPPAEEPMPEMDMGTDMGGPGELAPPEDPFADFGQ